MLSFQLKNLEKRRNKHTPKGTRKRYSKDKKEKSVKDRTKEEKINCA